MMKGNGSNITISGGYISAASAEGSSIGGGGTIDQNSENITIIGGYFGDSSATTGEGGTVYGCSVESYCTVEVNTDTETSSDYPYKVYISKAFQILDSSGAIASDGYEYTDHILNITTGGTYIIGMVWGLDSTDTDRIQVTAANSKVIIILDNVSISSSLAPPFEITEDATSNVTIKLSGNNTLTANVADKAGLQKTSESNMLIITSADGDGSENGSLTVSNTQLDAPAIGGMRAQNVSNITINGGTINATANCYGAGIGGGGGGSAAYNIVINGGNITATGGLGCAGIGGGSDYGNNGQNTGNVTINGGTVIATGGTNVAGIGSGISAPGNVTITGGTVTAIGGSNGAGIGGGQCETNANGKTGTVTISGGYIKATAGSNASAIGNGANYSTSTGSTSVTINGGYFAADSSTSTSNNQVYGIDVADDYHVYDNTDTDTKNYYPYIVVSTTNAFIIKASVSGGYTYTSNVLDIFKGGEYAISMNTYAGITTTDTDRISVTATDSKVIITLDGVNISSSSVSPFEVNSTQTVTIKLSGDNVLDASNTFGYAGLQKTSTDNMLTITSAVGDSETDGSLTASGVNGAGIGGGAIEGNGSYITINGGTVNAASTTGAGIGGENQ